MSDHQTDTAQDASSRDSATAAAADTDVLAAGASAPTPPTGPAAADGTALETLADSPAAVEPAADAPTAESPTAATDAPAAAAAPADLAEIKRRGRPRTPVENLVVGTEYHGKVVGMAKFGVFVDIGAMTDGLVHLTEFPKRGVRKPEDVVKSGDMVDVWVKEVDLENGRVALSMRRRPAHPMSALSVGDVLTGKVTTIAKYGAFVDIGSDTEGLVHISEMSSGFVQKPEDVVRSGDAVEVRIKELDQGKERISLSMKGLANDVGVAVQAEADSAAAMDAAADVTFEEPEERMPTMLEFALRQALGDTPDEAAGTPKRRAARSTGKPARDPGMGDVYTRMLEEYRANKAAGK